MRIAIVAEVYLPKIDGVVQRTMNLIRQLLNAGDDVLVVCPQTGATVQSPVPMVEFSSFPFPPYPEFRIGTPDQRLISILGEFKPDVLHYVNPFAFGFQCCDLLQRSGFRAPSIFSFHTLYGEFVKRYRLLAPLSRLLWWLMRDYHNRANINLTVSTIMQEELVTRGFERVKLWPPAVDSSLFCPDAKSAPMRARLAHGHPDKRLLLTVSRLAPEKNVAFLASVLDRVPNSCLAIVGDGPQRPELERCFAGKPANFIGYLKGEELAAAYASADAFVYASETETMGNVVLEAMASGCAVVAPKAGGIPSLVDSGQTGMLFSPGDIDEAVRQTRLTLDDDLVRLQLGRAARDWVEQRGWSHSIQQVRKAYLNAIDEFQRTTSQEVRPHRLAHAVLASLVTGFKLVPQNGKSHLPVSGVPNAESTISMAADIAVVQTAEAATRQVESSSANAVRA